MTGARRGSDWNAAAEYHRPPPTPRDEMWGVIEERLHRVGVLDGGGRGPAGEAARLRGEGRWAPGESASHRSPWLRRAPWLALAASAVLAVGVGLDRAGRPVPGGVVEEEPPSPAATAARGRALRKVASAHLAESESLLAFVQADARNGRADPQVGSWGRALLVETRLLLDSEVSTDPALREVLEDLEVILAQVALLADPSRDSERNTEELEIIVRGLQQGQMMARLQSALPAADGSFSGI